MVLPSFVRQALEGKPITVYGDGSQRRCFCSVHDVVEGLTRLPRVPSAAGRVINLGSQEEISIRALAARVRDILHSDSEIVYIPYEEAYGAGFDDMQRRIPDLTRAKDLMGWAPKHSIEEIISEVATHMRITGLEAYTP